MYLLIKDDLVITINHKPLINFDFDSSIWNTIKLDVSQDEQVKINENFLSNCNELTLKIGNDYIKVKVNEINFSHYTLSIKPLYCELN